MIEAGQPPAPPQHRPGCQRPIGSRSRVRALAGSPRLRLGSARRPGIGPARQRATARELRPAGRGRFDRCGPRYPDVLSDTGAADGLGTGEGANLVAAFENGWLLGAPVRKKII
jgi:hypothetical protein